MIFVCVGLKFSNCKALPYHRPCFFMIFQLRICPCYAQLSLLHQNYLLNHIYCVSRNPSRRHLFLGQMLLLGLLSCAAMSAVYTLKPSPVSCAVIRLGSGLAYSIVYSTLLVKLVFRSSPFPVLNSSKCSWVSVQAGFAICSRKPRKTAPV